MKYFHTDNPETVHMLANMLIRAALDEKRVRLMTTEHNHLMVKIGEGAWTAPISSTHDSYRDQ